MKLLSSKSPVANIELENELIQARAEYLRNNLYVANTGSTAVFLVLAFFSGDLILLKT